MSSLELRLLRLTETPTATLGVLLINGFPELTTLELPWVGNQRNISRIPPGRYPLIRRKDARTSGGLEIPFTVEVGNVPGRSGILFHVGNSSADTQGCILVGLRWGNVQGKSWVYESRIAFERLATIAEQSRTGGWITVSESF